MSPLAAPLATFLFFSGFAAAQVYAPFCTVASAWMLNSLDQNPCLVVAYLGATCYGGSFSVSPLRPGGSYNGPSGVDDTDPCKCNTVTYSLISACGACQGAKLTRWSEYSLNCTKSLPPSSSLILSLREHGSPNGLSSISHTFQSEDIWDSSRAIAVGGFPEQAPGAILGLSGTTVSTPPSTRSGATSSLFGESSSAVKPTSSPIPKSSSNTDVIVGGAVGGVAAISLIIAIGFFLRRRRREAPIPVAPSVAGASQPPMDEVQQPLTMHDGYTASSIPSSIGSSMPGTPVAPIWNDPNYPSTFLGYQGVPQTPAMPSQGAVPSLNGTGNSLATMQTSRPQGYHGFPTV